MQILTKVCRFSLILFSFVLFFYYQTVAYSEIIHRPGLGIFVAGKAGMSAQGQPDGHKAAVGFSALPDIMIQGFVPLSSTRDIGMTFEVGYSSFSFGQKILQNASRGPNEDIVGSIEYSALSAGAHFHLNVLSLGLVAHFPQSGSVESKLLADPASGDLDLTGKMRTQWEGKVTLTVPILENRTGRLSFVLSGGYSLTQLMFDWQKDTFLQQKYSAWDVTLPGYNPRQASLSIGFSYLFSLVRP